MSPERLINLGQELGRLRKSVGQSGRTLAFLASVPQPTISRVENGQRVRSVEVVERIISALPLDEGEAARLRSNARAAYAEEAPPRIDSGFSLKSDAVRRLERSATVVWSFQSAVLPRLLRTAEYSQAAGMPRLNSSDLLDDESRAFRFLVTEGALRTWPGAAEVMPGQLNHLTYASTRPNLWLGVIPWSTPMHTMPPHGFTVYDQAAVSVETFTAELTITDPNDVTAYRDAFADLERAAVTGDEALAVLDTIREDLGRFH
ncbi:helix-turn-helix domain-containing protein [Spiractinospora alimapuensis]|uniref:helix-turn-helix domain-containing protein n=1 Tax=Spiractinospora alimapuensis TaxID=2820884 RepID=UPI001F2EE569|nr:helix-turn-helix transcriptional regulator [Spiractinospora alimapuensis]QVQ50483.1 helix-turn-helix domain-containing protein [Spiractinospora alimapuensis]